MTAGVADRRTEMFFSTGEGSGQYPQEYPAGATKVAAVQANFHEGPTWI